MVVNFRNPRSSPGTCVRFLGGRLGIYLGNHKSFCVNWRIADGCVISGAKRAKAGDYITPQLAQMGEQKPIMWPNGVGNAKKRGIWRMIDGKQGIERNKNEGRLGVVTERGKELHDSAHRSSPPKASQFPYIR